MNDTYTIKTKLEVTYVIRAENKKDAQEIAKGYLLDKIDNKDVSYNELTAK